MKFTISHELNVSAEQYWKYLFDAELEDSVRKATNLKEFKVTSRQEGTTLVRDVRVVPDSKLPAALEKLIGDNIGYREEDRAPAGGMRYEWKATPDALPGKIHMGGTFVVEALGPNRCKRTIAGDCTVKIFGLGGLAEKFIVSELERNYGITAREQERWIKAKG